MKCQILNYGFWINYLINDNRIRVFITFACRVSGSVFVCVCVGGGNVNLSERSLYSGVFLFVWDFVIRISFVLGGGT